MAQFETSNASTKIRSILLHMVFIALGLGAVAGWGLVHFGSIPAVLAHLGGNALIADAYTKSFGSVTAGSDQEIRFLIKNCTNKSATIIGGRSSCTCLVAEDLPLTIAPGGESPVRIKISTSKGAGDIAERITLYTNAGNQEHSFIVLNVVGYVRGSQTDADGSRPQ